MRRHCRFTRSYWDAWSAWLCWLGGQTRFAENGWVCLGIFSGVVLALEYGSCFKRLWSARVGTNGGGSPISVRGERLGRLSRSAFLGLLGRLILFGSPSCRQLAVLSRDGAYCVVVAVIHFPESFPTLCLLCLTPWAVAAYGSAAAVWLVRRRKELSLQFTLWQLLLRTTWLAVNFAAWRTAVFLLMLAPDGEIDWQPPPRMIFLSRLD